MGMAEPTDNRYDTSGTHHYFLSYRSQVLACVLNEVRIEVDSFTTAVESHITNQTVIRGIKYTRTPGGSYLPTYSLLERFTPQVSRRPSPPMKTSMKTSRRTSRSLCPRARSTRRTRTSRGVITRLRWKSPGRC